MASRGTIAGFLSLTSAAEGDRISLYVSTPASFFDAEVYRLGWYNGGRDMATLVDRIASLPGMAQPRPTSDPETGLISAGNWTSNGTLVVHGWPTGLYLVKLIASDGDQSYVPLVIRDDVGSHEFLFEHASTTDQAYNAWGGKSLYAFNSTGDKTVSGTAAAVKVSFDRPFDGNGAGGVIRQELNMVRWLEANGFDVAYVSDIDVHRDPDFARRARAVIQAGHSEYWSKEMRDHLEAVREQGKGLGLFTGDTGAWAVRFEDSTVGSDRVEVGYKDAPDPLASIDPAHSTGHWRDEPLNRPTQAFFGLGSGAAIRQSGNWVVQGAATAADLFVGTGLKDGDVIPNLVGYEYDGLWTPGAGQIVADGLRILGSSRVAPVSKPDALLNFRVLRSIPESARPGVGRLVTSVETYAEDPAWLLYVHLVAPGRSVYLVYTSGSSSEAPRRRQVGSDDYGTFSVGDELNDPGWHPLERDLRADYERVFGAPPGELAVEGVLLRGSLSLGAMTLTAPDGRVVSLGQAGVARPADAGWRVQSGEGRLGIKPDGPGGEPALTMRVEVPGNRRPDDAHTVFISDGARGSIVAVGSIQWSWALDDDETFGRHADSRGNETKVDSRVQTLTRNLLQALVRHS